MSWVSLISQSLSLYLYVHLYSIYYCYPAVCYLLPRPVGDLNYRPTTFFYATILMFLSVLIVAIQKRYSALKAKALFTLYYRWAKLIEEEEDKKIALEG